MTSDDKKQPSTKEKANELADEKPDAVKSCSKNEAKLIFRGSDKHGSKDIGEGRGRISRAPKNGQAALDNSVQVKDTSPRRVGVDKINKEIVVLDQTSLGEFHGHVRDWDDLTSQQQNALIKQGAVNKKGKINP